MRRGDLALIVAVVLAALAMGLAGERYWLGLCDEGFNLLVADAVNRGQALYRDVYVDGPFPLGYLLLAGILKTFGTSVLVARRATAVLFAVLCATSMLVALRLAGRRAALMTGLALLAYRLWAFPHWHVISYSAFSVVFLWIALTALLARLGRLTRTGLIVVGALVGASVLSKQHYGLALLATWTIALALDARLGGAQDLEQIGPARSILCLNAGAALVGLPVLVYLIATGAFIPFLEQTLLWPVYHGLQFPYRKLPPLWPLGQDPAIRENTLDYFPPILFTPLWQRIASHWLYRDTAVTDLAIKLAFYLPLFALGGALATLLIRRPRHDSGAWRCWLYVTALLGALWLSFMPPRDWVHLMMVYPALIVLLVPAIHAWAGAGRSWMRRGVRDLADASLVATLLVGLALAWRYAAHLTTDLGLPRADVKLSAGDTAVVREAVEFLERRVPAGQPATALPYFPMITFAAGYGIAGGYPVVWPVQDAARRDPKMIAGFDAAPVDALVYGITQFPHTRPFRVNAPKLYEYLVDHFAISEVITAEGSGIVLAGVDRRAPEPPGVKSLRGSLGRAIARAGDRQVPIDDVAREDLWPFARVFAQQPGSVDAPTSFELPLGPLVAGEVLRFAVAVDPDRWVSSPCRIEMQATLEPGSRAILSRTLAPLERLADRGWFPVEVRLDQWTSEPVTVRFSATARDCTAADAPRVGWGDLRIVSQSGT